MFRKAKENLTQALVVSKQKLDPVLEKAQQKFEIALLNAFNFYVSQFPKQAAIRSAAINSATIEAKEKNFRDAQDWAFVAVMFLTVLASSLFALSLTISTLEATTYLLNFVYDAAKFIASSPAGLSLNVGIIMAVPGVYLGKQALDLKFTRWQLAQLEQAKLTNTVVTPTSEKRVTIVEEQDLDTAPKQELETDLTNGDAVPAEQELKSPAPLILSSGGNSDESLVNVSQDTTVVQDATNAQITPVASSAGVLSYAKNALGLRG